MKVAIVGSRRFKNKEAVLALVDALGCDDVVISGGCRGVDVWAIGRAKERGLEFLEFFPELYEDMTYFERCQAYYDRNELIVKNCDVVHAFVAADRKGGTENTIKFAKMHKVPVIIHEEEDK